MNIYNDGLTVGSRGGVDWVNPRYTKGKTSNPYSYSEFYLARSVPVADVKKYDGVYSDRLQEWNREKFEEAGKPFQKRFDQFSLKDCSAFLTAYYGKPVTAVALAEGCNVSNGYPYWIFWFKDKY